MEISKETISKQTFKNFDNSYKLLKKYINKPITTELERAGIIQFFEMTFDLSSKVLKDYLQTEGYIVKTPREILKKSFQLGLIDNYYIWIDALSNKNLTIYTYNEDLADKILREILYDFLPELEKMYDKFIF